MAKKFHTFAEFYPVYLAMHSNATNRRLHLSGNLAGLSSLLIGIATASWWLLLAAPILGNGLAWIGHYGFQRNRPGVFSYPLYGFLGSWAMTRDVLTGKLRP